jgi:hypothetical protein
MNALTDEITYYKQKLSEALEQKDGYQCWYWGSTLMHLQKLKADSERRMKEHLIEMINLKYQCEHNSICNMIEMLIHSHKDIPQSLYNELELCNQNHQKEISRRNFIALNITKFIP